MKTGHTALYANDLEAARAFFARYFAARTGAPYHNPRTGLRSYFLSFDGGARLELMSRPDTEDAPKGLFRTGYAHLAFSAGGKGEVDRLTEQLRTDGFRVISGPRTTGDGYYESCIVGPEGNLIEITE